LPRFTFFATALEDGDAWRWYGAYACVALAVLTKGLLAVVVVGLALLLYVAISGEWRRWREFHLFTGTLLFLVIAAPWHVLAGIRNPHFFWFYFVNEHFMRFLGKRIPKDYNKQTSSLYWTLHLVWLFPWSLYLPVALRSRSQIG
jgi:4-amino-4-deoxy-L-arabinose transferase-like glycosyltransferase